MPTPKQSPNEQALTKGKSAFLKYLREADTSKGAVQKEVIKFHLTPEVESALNEFIESHGCTMSTRIISREEQDRIDSRRKNCAQYTTIVVTPEAQATFMKNQKSKASPTTPTKKSSAAPGINRSTKNKGGAPKTKSAPKETAASPKTPPKPRPLYKQTGRVIQTKYGQPAEEEELGESNSESDSDDAESEEEEEEEMILVPLSWADHTLYLLKQKEADLHSFPRFKRRYLEEVIAQGGKPSSRKKQKTSA
ncbi:hypothetical protein FB45DRAFT_997700 [Roridomyces roridus]|uniref:Uncharacterized protein n=1 Tax=Roridomyces roridus TaxID=1738132 RepID=A0AAD7CKU4_9AGAR|nr:hypothetical protein FB45DRAFT_997700 [Roridomyces roridus]